MRSPIQNDIAVIDTNIVRILSDRRHSPERDFYRAKLQGKLLRISFMTAHEVRWGIQDSQLGARRRRQVLADLNRYRIVQSSDALIAASVQLRFMCRHQPLATQDLFIASSALALGCPFATDDRRLAEALAGIGVAHIISRHLEDAN